MANKPPQTHSPFTENVPNCIYIFFWSRRFDPDEPITHGVETLNHCEVNVDVAVARNNSWTLQSEEEARAKIIGKELTLCGNKLV